MIMMVPMPKASIDILPRPLMGCGVIGRRDWKSERKGDIWQDTPVLMINGRFEDDEGAIEEATKEHGEERTEKAEEKGAKGKEGGGEEDGS